MKLADRDCELIEAGALPLSEADVADLADQVPDWIVSPGALERTLKFASFEAAMRYAVAVARLAVEQDHHPRICIDYDTVELTLTTHKIGGLSMNDLIMAAKIDRLPV